MGCGKNENLSFCRICTFVYSITSIYQDSVRTCRGEQNYDSFEHNFNKKQGETILKVDSKDDVNICKTLT